MRKPATIKKDIARYERALDGVIGMVTNGSSRPDRTWAMGCHAIMNRIDEFRGELALADKR